MFSSSNFLTVFVKWGDNPGSKKLFYLSITICQSEVKCMFQLESYFGTGWRSNVSIQLKICSRDFHRSSLLHFLYLVGMKKIIIMEVGTLLEQCSVKAQLRSHVLQMAVISACIFLDLFFGDLLPMSSCWATFSLPE